MNRKQFITGLSVGAMAMPSMLEAQVNSKKLTQLPSVENWEQIQKQFLVLKSRVYMNNGTMGITPKTVLQALGEAFEHVARDGYYSSDFNTLKSRLAPLLHVDKKALAITKNVTDGLNIACWGVDMNAGDEVLMTKHEHVGGCAAWLHRAKVDGIKIKTFDLAMTAEQTLTNFKKALSPKTKIIAVPHIPCTIGQILPIKELCQEARKREITTLIDGAHPLGMIPINISELGCDYYAGCLHKWLLGPLGLGFLYIHPDRLNKTVIRNLGAYSIAEFDMTVDQPINNVLNDDTQRFSPGTFCGPLYVAGVRAIDWYQSIGIERIEKRIKELSLYTHESLEKLNLQLETLSPREDISRGAQTTFRFKGKKASDFVNYARSHKDPIILRHVHEARLDAVRISTHYYNDFNHIDKLMEMVRAFEKS